MYKIKYLYLTKEKKFVYKLILKKIKKIILNSKFLDTNYNNFKYKNSFFNIIIQYLRCRD